MANLYVDSFLSDKQLRMNDTQQRLLCAAYTDKAKELVDYLREWLRSSASHTTCAALLLTTGGYMGVDRDIELLIKRYGGKLVREKRHAVYKFPDGRCFTLPRTPSDWLGAHNAMTDLRKFLGIEREIHKNPNRKPKIGVKGKPAFAGIATGVAMCNWRRELNVQARKLHLLSRR